MKIRCIALDLDRTTLNAQGTLSPGNRAALCHAIDQGIHIVIASGRSFRSLPEEVTSLPGIEYAITANGAAIYHLPSGKCLHRCLLLPQSVEALLTLTKDESLVYEAFVDGDAYAPADYIQHPGAYGASEWAVPFIQQNRRPVPDIRQFIQAHIQELDSLALVLPDSERTQQLWDRLKTAAPELYITSSVPQLLELAHRDAGKHSGLRFVNNLLGLTPQETAAFGDGDNDADMLAYAGCGIAMENATPACKAAADYITLNHDQDGLSHGIYQILHL